MAKGDQLYVWRELANVEGIYEHHGIDCGDGDVIHYRKPSEIIEKTPFSTFSKGNPVYIREYPIGFCFIGDVVVNRAINRLGENKYNLLFNNCEHFATWCKTGVNDSKQVREFVPILNKLDAFQLLNPIKDAMKITDKNNTEEIFNKALVDIKTVWNQIQPLYQKGIDEIEIWNKIAQQAIQNNRDDLAKEALKRKLDYKKQVQDIQKQLESLAVMTENLIQNKRNI